MKGRHAPQPSPDRSVDAALAAMVIHEMPEPVRMLQEVRRLLAPTGRLFIMDWVRVPLAQHLSGRDHSPFEADVDPDDRANLFDHFLEHNKFSRDDLAYVLEQTGFAIEAEHSRGDGQFAWMVASPRD